MATKYTAKFLVNHHKGKVSHLLITADQNVFSGNTKCGGASAAGAMGGGSKVHWDGKVTGFTSNTLKVRLTRSSKSVAGTRDDTPTENISVVITNPSDTPSFAAEYVDDDESP
jgi:hypothetical protein